MLSIILSFGWIVNVQVLIATAGLGLRERVAAAI
jgi:hypothetical protein